MNATPAVEMCESFAPSHANVFGGLQKKSSPRKRKRILFLAEGITMTHFVRPAALAATLDPAEYDVYFRTPQRYHRLLNQEFRQLGDLRTIDPQAFLESLSHGSTLYTEKTLRGYVRDDLEIINEVQPDFVFGDFRLSLCISAPLSGVPFGSIFNAQWSPYRKQPAIVPELPITNWVSPRLLAPLFALLRPAIFALHAKPVNDLRREFGLPRISNDMRDIYTTGDMVLYPDTPEFVPTRGAPEHHHYVGICNWSPSTPKPAWWNEVMDSQTPKVFISLGSSGPVKALPAVLEAVSQLPVKVIVATSGRRLGALGPNVYAADLLPYEETSRHCSAVVSQGGTAGLYLTLAAGVPMLSIPNNIDNHLSAALMEEHGAGLSVRVEHASPRRIRKALERLLYEPGFKAAAGKFATSIASHDTRRIFPQLLAQWFARNEKGAACPAVNQEVYA
jgi:UDP:flavonoid glycosyltransferase YjiC (YdhE family)